jgi:hypothetical protein
MGPILLQRADQDEGPTSIWPFGYIYIPFIRTLKVQLSEEEEKKIIIIAKEKKKNTK